MVLRGGRVERREGKGTRRGGQQVCRPRRVRFVGVLRLAVLPPNPRLHRTRAADRAELEAGCPSTSRRDGSSKWPCTSSRKCEQRPLGRSPPALPFPGAPRNPARRPTVGANGLSAGHTLPSLRGGRAARSATEGESCTRGGGGGSWPSASGSACVAALFGCFGAGGCGSRTASTPGRASPTTTGRHARGGPVLLRRRGAAGRSRQRPQHPITAEQYRAWEEVQGNRRGADGAGGPVPAGRRPAGGRRRPGGQGRRTRCRTWPRRHVGFAGFHSPPRPVSSVLRRRERPGGARSVRVTGCASGRCGGPGTREHAAAGRLAPGLCRLVRTDPALPGPGAARRGRFGIMAACKSGPGAGPSSPRTPRGCGWWSARACPPCSSRGRRPRCPAGGWVDTAIELHTRAVPSVPLTLRLADADADAVLRPAGVAVPARWARGPAPCAAGRSGFCGAAGRGAGVRRRDCYAFSDSGG